MSELLERNEEITALIQNIIQHMGIEAQVSLEQSTKGSVFNISSPDSNLLIGQKGANLQALQSVVQSIAFHKFNIAERFSLDVDDYKKKREWYLRETAKKAVEHLRRSKRPTALEPMPAYERRVIHAYLSQEPDIDTESMGEEPNRRIVIRLKEKGDLF